MGAKGMFARSLVAVAVWLTTFTLLTFAGPPRPVLAADDGCDRVEYCIAGADGGPAAVWESGAGELVMLVEKPFDKPRTFTLTLGQADGNSGRIKAFHQLDVKREYAGANPLTVVVQAGQLASNPFQLKFNADTEVEPDEWFDMWIQEDGENRGHRGVRVVDDDIDNRAVTLKVKAGFELIEGANWAEAEVTYTGTLGPAADITLVADQDPDTGRQIEITPNVVRLRQGESVTVLVEAVDDGVAQPPSKVALLAYPVGTGDPDVAPEPLDIVVADLSRTPSAQSAEMQSTDPSAVVSLKIDNYYAEEGLKPPKLIVTRTGNLEPAFTVGLEWESGSAQVGSDLFPGTNEPPTAVTFASGETVQQITIPLGDDDIWEGDETYTVRLVNTPTGVARGAVWEVEGTIQDTADFPFPQIVPGGPVHVGHTGAQPGFHIAISAPPPAVPVTYRVTTVYGEASSPDDYEHLAIDLTIPAGQTNTPTFTVTVHPVANPGSGKSRGFALVVSHPMVDQTDYAWISIDDPLEPPAVFQRPDGAPDGPHVVVLHEGTAGPITHQLTVTKPSFIAAGPYEVDVNVLPMGDIERVASDVTVSPSTLVLTEDDPTASLSVTIAGNDIEQDDLKFAVVLVNERRWDDWAVEDDAAEFTIVDDDAPSPDNAADKVRGGLDDWFAGLRDWLEAFRLPTIEWPPPDDPSNPDEQPFDLPTLPDLDDLFDLGELFDDLPAPQFDVDDDALDDAVDDFKAAGCPVDFVVGGAGGAPEAEPGDLLQVHCTRTLAEIAEASGWTDGADGFPEGFADLIEAAGLTATIDADWNANEIEFHVIAGVDTDGFYLLGSTGIRIRGVTASGVVSGTGTVLGVQNSMLVGTAAADLTVSAALAADPDTRVRVAVDPFEPVTRVAGSADLTLAASVDDTHLDWDGHWQVVPNSDPLVVTTTQEITITQELPGFAVGAAADPVTIELHGEYGTCEGAPGWALSGTATPDGDPITLDGFAVTELSGSGCISAASTQLDFEAAVEIGAGDPHASVAVTVSYDGTAWTTDVASEAHADELVIGPVTITDADLDLAAAFDGGTGELAFTVGVSAATATLGSGSGAATLTGITGRVQGIEQLTLDVATATIGNDHSDLEFAGVHLAVPGVNGVVFSTDTIEATVGGVDGLTIVVSDLKIHTDGRFSATSATLRAPSGLLGSFGLGALVPVDVNELWVEFTNVDPVTDEVVDLSQFAIGVDATVDLSGFAGLPFTPTFQLGDDVVTPDSPPGERNVTFSVRVESLDPLVVTPLDVGPVLFELRDLTVGPLTFDVELSAKGYEGGVLQPGFSGTVEVVAGDWAEFNPGASVTISNGQITNGPDGPRYAFDAAVGFSAGNDEATVEDLTATLHVVLGLTASDTPVVDVQLEGLAVGLVSVPFGSFAELRLTDAELILGPNGSFTIGGSLDEPGTGAQLVFLDAFPLLAGWGGRVGGVRFDADLNPTFTDGFFAEVIVGDLPDIGLPDFLPLQIERIGIALPDDVAPGDPLDDVLANLRISITGGINGTQVGFPVEASVDELSVDIGKLLDFDPATCGFDPACLPVDLAGFRLALSPLDLGGASVSGELAFGRIEDLPVCPADGGGTRDVLYGRISGNLRTPAFEAGADVVISEYGPVLLRVTAPLAVPIAQTGLVIQSVTGAAAFGDVSIPTPSPGNPEELLDPGGLADLPTDADIDAAAIRAQIAPSVFNCQSTWNDGFAIALSGNLTHVAAAGMLGGRVTLGMNVRPDAGPQLFGVGELEAFGVPLGDVLPDDFQLGDFEVGGSIALAGLLIDFANPLEPSIDLAFQSPAPGSPFALLIPGRSVVAAQLRTDGVLPGLIAGVQAGLASLDGSARDAIMERTGGSTDVDAVIAAFAAYAETLTAAEAAALAEQFFAAIADAAEAALRAADAEFNPSFVFRGSMQPTVLGIPFGDPSSSVEIIMTRASLGIGGTYSMMESLKSGLDPVMGSLLTASSFGLTDRLTFSVQLPVPDMTAVLFGDGELGPFGSNNPSWSGTLQGEIAQFGVTSQVTGFITSADNPAFVNARVERRWECSDGTTPVPPHCLAPPDPELIQFSRQVDYDRLLAHGGVVLDGRLEVPRLVTDPVDVLGDATADFPDDPLAMLAWFSDFGDTITQTETPVRATFFVPGPGQVLSDDQTPEEWAAGISMTGVWEGTRQDENSEPVARLLSIPIGEGRMLATTQGLEVTANIPLLGMDGTFVARVDEVPLSDEPDAATVTVPTGKLEVNMEGAALDAALAGLGLPAAFEASGVEGNAGFRAYTPGFDRDSDDPLQRGGGVAFDANLDAAGFVDDARASVALELATGNFTATAAADQLGPFGGVTVTDAEFTIAKVGPAVTVHVEGRADVLGSQWTVVGDLAPDLTGSLTLTGSGGSLPSLGGFEFVSGGLNVTLTRTGGGSLVGSVGLAGEVALPAWMAGRSANATVAAAGCLATNGNAELRLKLGTLALEPTGQVVLTGSGASLPALPGTACTLPSIPGMTNNDARLVVRRSSGVTTVAVDGALRVSGPGTPPLLATTGTFSSDGTGSLTVRFGAAGTGADGCTGTGGASIGGFTVKGCANLTLSGGNSFNLAVDGQIVVPGIGDLAATGSLQSDGDFDLAIATTGGIRLGGPSSPFFGVGAFRLTGVNDVYTFRATNAGFEYRQQNGTVLFGAGVPDFRISSNGSFSVTTAAFDLGPSDGVHLEVPATTLSANASGLTLRVRVPSNAKLVIPGLADGASGRPKLALTTAVDINTTNFRYVLFNSRQLNLGLLRLTGKLVFERVNGGPFQLAVEGPNASTPANVDLGDLGRVDFPAFRFATNGDFTVTATTAGLGPTNPRFRISDATIRLRNTGNATTTTADDVFELQINGGRLALPALPDPIALPNLSVRATNTFAREFTVPQIDLGPVFKTNQSATFVLTAQRSRVRFELKDVANNNPTMTALAGSSSMRLNDLLIDTNGAFTGSVTGRLQVFGNELAQGTFNVRLVDGLFELSLPSPGLNVNWGFGTVKVRGFVRSDGTFDFTGSIDTDGSVPGVVSWNGSVSVRATNARLSGTYNGTVNVFGVLSGSASATMDSTGKVAGTLRVDLDNDGDTNGVPGACIPATIVSPRICTPRIPERTSFSFQIGGSSSPDTTRPSMSQPSDITITTSETGSSIPVYFPHPIAHDNRDGAINSTCNPGSGSQFTIGATESVTCTARDGAGNSRSRTFMVTVNRTGAAASAAGNLVSMSVGGFGPGSATVVAAHSDPVFLQEVVADADGRAHYQFMLPDDLPAGDHHLVATGTDPDGNSRMWVVPIVMAEGGQLASIEDGQPDGALPPSAARFVPVDPVRLFDTRDGGGAAVGPDATLDVVVAGQVGVPADASAVVLNLTVTDTAEPGFVTAFPTGAERPVASSVNIVQPGQTRPNLVTVPIGADGQVSFYSLGAVSLIGDVAGYYVPADGAVAAGRFVALTPERLFDTREAGGKLAGDTSGRVPVLGVGSVPATGVAAVVLNLTGTDADGPGFVTAFPTGGDLPLASNVNLSFAGDTAPNLAIVPVGADGSITVYSSHGAHVLGDVTGYITSAAAAADTAGLFVPLTPERAFDTRDGVGFVGAGQSVEFAIGGVGSVPADAAGVVLNVTGIDSPLGFLTAWPTGPARPVASTLNFVTAPLDTRANAAMLPVGEEGRVSFYTLNGSHLLADVAGYFL